MEGSVINCSQTNEVCSNYFSPVRLFNAIFRLTHLTFRHQKRDKQVVPTWNKVLLEPFSLVVSQYAIHRNCFGDILTM